MKDFLDNPIKRGDIVVTASRTSTHAFMNLAIVLKTYVRKPYEWSRPEEVVRIHSLETSRYGDTFNHRVVKIPELAISPSELRTLKGYLENK